MNESSSAFVEQLETIIRSRLEQPSPKSYTNRLAQAGVKRIAQKVGEEAVELGLASVDGDRDEVINEAADLVYHLLLLLNVQEIRLADVSAMLEKRHSG